MSSCMLILSHIFYNILLSIIFYITFHPIFTDTAFQFCQALSICSVKQGMCTPSLWIVYSSTYIIKCGYLSEARITSGMYHYSNPNSVATFFLMPPYRAQPNSCIYFLHLNNALGNLFIKFKES